MSGSGSMPGIARRPLPGETSPRGRLPLRDCAPGRNPHPRAREQSPNTDVRSSLQIPRASTFTGARSRPACAGSPPSTEARPSLRARLIAVGHRNPTPSIARPQVRPRSPAARGWPTKCASRTACAGSTSQTHARSGREAERRLLRSSGPASRRSFGGLSASRSSCSSTAVSRSPSDNPASGSCSRR